MMNESYKKGDKLICPKCSQGNALAAEYCWKCYFDFVPNAPSKIPITDPSQAKRLSPIYLAGWIIFGLAVVFMIIQGFGYGSIQGFGRRGSGGLPSNCLVLGAFLLVLDRDTFRLTAGVTILFCAMSFFALFILLAVPSSGPIEIISTAIPSGILKKVMTAYCIVSPIVGFWVVFEGSRLRYLKQGVSMSPLEDTIYRSRSNAALAILILSSIFILLNLI